jgi:hypothetical protein
MPAKKGRPAPPLGRCNASLDLSTLASRSLPQMPKTTRFEKIAHSRASGVNGVALDILDGERAP